MITTLFITFNYAWWASWSALFANLGNHNLFNMFCLILFLGKFWLIIVAQITSIQQNEFCIFNDIVSFMSCLQQDAIKRRKILYVVLWKIKAVYFAEVVWSKHNVLFKQCNTNRSRTTLLTGMIDIFDIMVPFKSKVLIMR